ncbi:MAG: archaeal flagellar protein FlaE [Methanothermococcus sp.]|jgi:flagellar protein FlaE|uniref:FlaE n=1 Tax=Methanothermococcus thermolithotrophicus TaxID=2186 RepID=Q9C4P6_METTL|nr:MULTISPECIES: FlaD/FlaE family flagellar protein [Methanothermococcus]AAG50074.1 FlaE [Methanothermococcus thermolithotrophicus]MDK2790260.1 archaeal flagellar protein FlaE [Methanothermococcus sp.]MDK2987736.1 archaeal flagellar protein FlaE [Methanothermococcus sp.]
MNTEVLSSILLESHKPAKLDDIPEDPISIIFAFKWLEYLYERVGSSNMVDVLDFYYNLGWISDKAISKLLKFSKGIYVEDDEIESESGRLTITDHLVSLLFIERLNGKKISGEMLDRIEWEIRRIKKGAEQYYGI